MPEVAVFPKVLGICLKAVGVRLHLLLPSEWLCDFSVRLILRVDAEITSRTEPGWLNAKLDKILGKQTTQTESRCFLISQNISKKLITLNNAQRALHRGAAGGSKFHLKELGTPWRWLQWSCPCLSIHLSVWQTGHSCWLNASLLLLLSWTSGSKCENELKLPLSPLPNRAVMRN